MCKDKKNVTKTVAQKSKIIILSDSVFFVKYILSLTHIFSFAPVVARGRW